MDIQQLLGPNFETIAIRMCVAALLCGVIGFERETKRRPAGFRTHLLVGLGACIMMVLSLYGFNSYLDVDSNIRFDPARIPSYVISGIGFLGAGTIIVKRGTIRGLTTASTVWVSAGVGLIVGVGMYGTALLSTIIVLLSLIVLNRFENKVMKSSNEKEVNIVVSRDASDHTLEEIFSTFKEEKINIKTFKVREDDQYLDQSSTLYTCIIDYKFREQDSLYLFLNKIYKINNVHKVFV